MSASNSPPPAESTGVYFSGMVEIGEASVKMDASHRLAGQDLVFDVEFVEIMRVDLTGHYRPVAILRLGIVLWSFLGGRR